MVDASTDGTMMHVEMHVAVSVGCPLSQYVVVNRQHNTM